MSTEASNKRRYGLLAAVAAQAEAKTRRDAARAAQDARDTDALRSWAMNTDPIEED